MTEEKQKRLPKKGTSIDQWGKYALIGLLLGFILQLPVQFYSNPFIIFLAIIGELLFWVGALSGIVWAIKRVTDKRKKKTITMKKEINKTKKIT